MPSIGHFPIRSQCFETLAYKADARKLLWGTTAVTPKAALFPCGLQQTERKNISLEEKPSPARQPKQPTNVSEEVGIQRRDDVTIENVKKLIMRAIEVAVLAGVGAALPLFDGRLPVATGFVVIGGRVEQRHTTRSPDRYTPVTAHLINKLALADRLQSFRRSASCSISLSRLRSATTLRSLLFSSLAASAAASRPAIGRHTSCGKCPPPACRRRPA